MSLFEDKSEQATFLDLNYLIKTDFQVNLKDLKYLVPESYLYYKDKLLQKAISCQPYKSLTQTNMDRTKLTQCSCESQCETSGDCCHDYWHYSGRDDDLTIVNEHKLDKKVKAIQFSNSLYNSCGILAFKRNDADVPIKLISRCSTEALMETTHANEFDSLTYDMLVLTDDYKTIYEKLCMDNSLHLENFDQAHLIKSIAQDTKTNLFYKNYFCARCNLINQTQIRILDTKIKCPLEYDLEAKRKNPLDTRLDFDTLFYKSPACIFAYAIDDDEDLPKYRPCNDYDSTLIDHTTSSFNKKQRLLVELELASVSLFKLNDNVDILADKVLRQAETFYTSLCQLYVLPVNIKVISYEQRIVTNGNFRNLFCYKAWLIGLVDKYDQQLAFDNLDEKLNILNNNLTEWSYENPSYKILIKKFDIIESLNENQMFKTHLHNVDIRQLTDEYRKLTRNLHESNDTWQLKRTKAPSSSRRIVEVLNKNDFRLLTHVNDTLGKYYLREQLQTDNNAAESTPFNFTIKINMIFLTKLKHALQTNSNNNNKHGQRSRSQHRFDTSQDSTDHDSLNLNDLSDDERFFLFKKIISETYVDRVIERYELADLLHGKYTVHMDYLPSKYINEYRYSVDIYLKVRFDGIKNIYLLNERVGYLQKLIENLMGKKDLDFFRTYTEAYIRRIEFVNYFQNDEAYDENNFLQCFDKDYELNSIEQFRVDYTTFLANHLITYIDVPSPIQWRQSTASGSGADDEPFKMLFVLNENSGSAYRYSIVYDSVQFKLGRKVMLKYCNLKSNNAKNYVHRNFTRHFQCDLSVGSRFELIKVNLEQFKPIITYRYHNDSYLTIRKASLNLTIAIDTPNSFAIVEGKAIFVCVGDDMHHYNDLFKLNSDLNDDDILSALWLNNQQMDEIIENIYDIGSDWVNMFWIVVSFMLAILLAYLHIRY